MATITLSSKNQVTIPVDIVRSLGLKSGDKLIAELMDDHIVLLPQPESWTDYFMGSAKGLYGSTVEEIDRYIAEVRYGWDIDALKDALAMDADLRAVYKLTSSEEECWLSEIKAKSGVKNAGQKLQELVELKAIKRLPDDKRYPADPRYRRIP